LIFAKKIINLSTFFLLRVNHDVGDNADVIVLNNPTIDRVVSHYGVNNVLIVIMLIISLFWDLLSLLHWKTIGKVVSVDYLQYEDMNAIVVKELHLKTIGKFDTFKSRSYGVWDYYGTQILRILCLI